MITLIADDEAAGPVAAALAGRGLMPVPALFSNLEALPTGFAVLLGGTPQVGWVAGPITSPVGAPLGRCRVLVAPALRPILRGLVAEFDAAGDVADVRRTLMGIDESEAGFFFSRSEDDDDGDE